MSKIQNRIYKFSSKPTKIGKNVRYFDGQSNTSQLGAGDSFYIHDLFNPNEADKLFRQLIREVDFVQMFNVSSNRQHVTPIPRMVSAQTNKSGGHSALYRMPGCNQSNIETTDWSATVQMICQEAEKRIDQPLNHCVCTLFRSESDSLGFHTDKLIDLDEHSLILSASFGAARPMLLHEIDGPGRHVVVLKPGSLLAIGPETNRLFEHSIPKLKDPVGARISLSIRHCKTYVDYSNHEVIGKGAEHQTKNYPFIRSHDDLDQYPPVAQKLITDCCRSSEAELSELRRMVEIA